MKQFAVCYVRQDSPTMRWTVVFADNAREAANKVREQNSLCNICEVYKLVEAWKWN